MMKKFKQELARVFDDNLRTKQWQNWVDYAIIGLIVISTVEVFLSTFDDVANRYGDWLRAVDLFTTIFFTIEVPISSTPNTRGSGAVCGTASRSTGS